MHRDLKVERLGRLHSELAPDSLSKPELTLLSQLSGSWQPHSLGDVAMSPVPSLPSEPTLSESMVVTFPPEVDSPGSVSTGQADAASRNLSNVFRNVTDLTTAPEVEQTYSSERWIRLLDYIAAALVVLNSIALILELELEGQDAARIWVGSCFFTGVTLMHFGFTDRIVKHVTVSLMKYSAAAWDFGVAQTTKPERRERVFWLIIGALLVPLAGSWRKLDMLQRSTMEGRYAVEWCWKESVFGIASQPVSNLLRAISSLRALRLLRVLRLCNGLQVLLKACQSFASSLCWSMVLLLIFIIVGALVIGNILQDFIQDQSANLEDRQWIWHHYGTAYRSWLTLYEVTFAGSWPTRTRPVLDKVSQGFAIFFVFYITVIAFALIRIITAIFLKDTLDAANNDAELQIMENMTRREKFVRHLQGIFRAIDDTGDGMITQERLEKVLSNPKVRAYFQTLDLDITESTALFHLLDDGDGEVTLHEFISGILRCKGHARAIDQVALHTDIKMLDKKISRLGEVLVSSSGRRSDVVSDRHLRDSHAELLCMFNAKSMSKENAQAPSSFHSPQARERNQ
ncbi:ANKRD17 [Symbiodinium sp. CCMP2592]|nr:ANKRD17 [Symbiodinium sp. CCMP2592]